MAQQRQVDVAHSKSHTTDGSGYRRAVTQALLRRQALLQAVLAELHDASAPLACAAELLVDTLRRGCKVLVAGNGGSAAEAQHFAAELVGRFQHDRAPYAALALTTDSSIVTAVANDYGYEHVFARQVFALGQPGDLLLAYSTSGESENLLRAAVAGRQCGLAVVAVTGSCPSRLERVADLTIRVPVSEAAAAQELHMMVTHILCGIAERELSGLGDPL